MTQTEAALRVHDVRYSYGQAKAVDGVSFEVRRGEVFGLLGPNGAGKTTTISMIAGLLPPASGHIQLFGQEIGTNAGRARGRMGVVPQDLALYEELTARENLRFWGGLYGMSGAALDEGVKRALDLVGLSDRAGDRVVKLSGGLKRRVNLAAALVHQPDLLLLDEPTVGIDPQARLRILDVVKGQVTAGRGVLYTSHYLEEAEQICDRLAIIDHGRVLAMGTLAEMHRMVGDGPIVNVRAEMTDDAARAIAAKSPGATFLSGVDRTYSFSCTDGAACSGLVRELLGGSMKLDDLRVQEPSLQSLFLKLTGRELRD